MFNWKKYCSVVLFLWFLWWFCFINGNTKYLTIDRHIYLTWNVRYRRLTKIMRSHYMADILRITIHNQSKINTKESPSLYHRLYTVFLSEGLIFTYQQDPAIALTHSATAVVPMNVYEWIKLQSCLNRVIYSICVYNNPF